MRLFELKQEEKGICGERERERAVDGEDCQS